MKPALALIALLLFATPAFAAEGTLDSAEALVRGQYAAAAYQSPEAVARLYAPENAQEMVDPIRGAGAVNLGVDPRYGQDNWSVTGVTAAAEVLPDGKVRVVVRFLNFGKPAEIDWTLAPALDTPSGWRVWDIAGPDQNDWAAFDMRQMLNLTK